MAESTIHTAIKIVTGTATSDTYGKIALPTNCIAIKVNNSTNFAIVMTNTYQGRLLNVSQTTPSVQTNTEVTYTAYVMG